LQVVGWCTNSPDRAPDGAPGTADSAPEAAKGAPEHSRGTLGTDETAVFG